MKLWLCLIIFLVHCLRSYDSVDCPEPDSDWVDPTDMLQFESSSKTVKGNEKRDWVDPGDMLHYDTGTKTMKTCEKKVDSTPGELKVQNTYNTKYYMHPHNKRHRIHNMHQHNKRHRIHNMHPHNKRHRIHNMHP